ncbi:MAG: PQQ-dependent sugar dehydrogenase [Chloroflexota bacterium]
MMKTFAPKTLIFCILLFSLTLLGCAQDVSPTPAVTPPIAATHTAVPDPIHTPESAAPTATLTPQEVSESPAEPTAVPTAEPTPEPTETTLVTTAVSQIQLEQIAGGYTRPTFITHAFDDRLFIVEERGLVTILQNGQRLDTPFLDIQDRVNDGANEQGLFTIVFHPDYADNGYFYLNYTNAQGSSVISRMSVSADDPNRGDPDSELVMLVIGQPFGNHNGGQSHFGPDGYLYIGLGDGGSAGDPQNHGQDATTLLGSMLRIDVDSNSERGYAIPPDNPYLDSEERPNEIWAIGLRNPWRFSFDRHTGDLYIADVGQNAWEEIHLVPAETPGGINFGWNIMEGTRCYSGPDCDQTGLDIPIHEYDHSQGCSITGGYVYRGQAHPELWGNYFFADYCSGNIWALVAQDDGDPIVNLVLQSSLGPASFGEDADGELYISDHRGGGIYRIVP